MAADFDDPDPDPEDDIDDDDDDDDDDDFDPEEDIDDFDDERPDLDRRSVDPDGLDADLGYDEVDRAPICPSCGVTALPAHRSNVLDSHFLCDNDGCDAFGEQI